MPSKRQRRGSGAATMRKRVKWRQNEEEEEERIDAAIMSEKERKAKGGGKNKRKMVLFPSIVYGEDWDGDTDSSSSTSLSSQDSDFEFDNVAVTSTSKSKSPKAKFQPCSNGKAKGKGNEKAPVPPETLDDSADDSEMEWENELASTDTAAPVAGTEGESSSAFKSIPVQITGDLELPLDKSSENQLTSTKKKGASFSNRQLRILTHCMHVQFLMFHGALRNSWCCDLELQGALLSLLTPEVLQEIEKYQSRQAEFPFPPKNKFSKTSDPLLKLLHMLLYWWKQRFTPDAPGLRKNGYKPLSQFEGGRDKPRAKFKFTTGMRDKDGEEVFTIFENLGERVERLEGFKRLASECRGSRDTGAALFTALMRALGIQARLVVSLQPLGFGFGDVEESVKETAVKGGAKNGTTAEKGRRRKRKKVESSEEENEDEDSGNETHAAPQKKTSIPDSDLPYPTTWTEVFSPHTKSWISLTTHPRPFLSHSTSPLHPAFEPKGRKATLAKQCIAYVIAYAADGTAVDVTPKYLSKLWPGKTKGFRIPVSDVPVYGSDGRTVMEVMKRDWFDDVMKGYRKPQEKMSEDERREETELRELREWVPQEGAGKKKGREDSIGFYKNNPDFVLERHLKPDEAVIPGRSHARTFISGKGAKEKTEEVYAREDIAICKTVEDWYLEGRVIKEGVQPLKQVQKRAATLTQRREIEEKELKAEVAMQGLYCLAQTELYIPPPITNGKIPKNSSGNIDIYVPSMIPPGAVHVALKRSARVAKKLGIDYAEAVTGFEFKTRRAVPKIEGIIIATENEDVLRDVWTAEEAEKRRKEDAKRQVRALAMWREFLKGLRSSESLGEEDRLTQTKTVRVPKGVSITVRPHLDADKFGLIQETYNGDPYKVIIASIFLNKTGGKSAFPVLEVFLEKYPTPLLLSHADVNQVTNLLTPLGLQNIRANRLIALGRTWTENPPLPGKGYVKRNYPPSDTKPFDFPPEAVEERQRPRHGVERGLLWEVAHLPGVGAYGLDTWRVFCRDNHLGKDVQGGEEPEWKSVVPKDKELRAYIRWKWAKEGYRWKEAGDEKAEEVRRLLAEKARIEQEQQRKKEENERIREDPEAVGHAKSRKGERTSKYFSREEAKAVGNNKSRKGERTSKYFRKEDGEAVRHTRSRKGERTSKYFK
ncbi:hypothetical protein RUND412_008151 [Rhizina undulata]